MISFNLFLQLLLSTILFSFAAAADIRPGQSLSAANPNEKWNSPNQTFSLGFISETPDAHFAAITYNNISVWKAGGDAGVADSTASLTFLPDGNLRLVNGSSGSVVWQSNTAGRGVTVAALDDSGNFVLRNGSVSVWSTFDNPSDTILPGQNFTVNNVLRSGLYSFRLVNSGNLTLRWNDSIVYWTLGLNSSINTNLTSPSLGLQPIGILSLSDPMLSTSVIMAYSSDYAEGPDIFRFTKLDNDGNLRIYSSSLGNAGNQFMRWAAVSDQCQVFGYCGNLGICSYNGSNPVCGCPSQNFDPIDPTDGRKGCRRKVEIANCPGSATMLELDNAKFLTYPPELSSQVFFIGISACRLNCLVSGSCIASTSLSDGTGLCYLKVPSFVSAYQSPALPSTSYLKVCGPVTPNPSPTSENGKRWKLRPWIVIVVVIGTLLGLILAELGLWFWCCKNSPKLGVLSAQYALLEYASGAPVQFSYKDLQRATKGFKEKLGSGGFGAVYRGVLANRTVVAIVSGRRNFEVSDRTNRKKFSVWAYEEFEKGNMDSVIDPKILTHEFDMDQIRRVIEVSFWCIQEQPSQRPMMGKVVQMLEGVTEIEKPPAPKVGSAIDGSVAGTSTYMSSSVSTLAPSVQPPSSSSSLQTPKGSSFASGMNIERASSSLLQSVTL
ncbi:unnamed protein product [Lactuca saligna]|uniref:non-specific serine/threonine protein kinase n=1 Tax=Lactuca saligna TaxID=75948 RepID=A0AA35VCX6_LACSI|nr:unnamed protein product [Lactuca saligna]